MPRHITDTAKYFPHYSDASAGDTMTMIQAAYKNDGYAFWFRILERLAAADGHYLDMRNAVKWRTLAAKSYISADIADGIMAILIETETIDVDLWREHRVIWCQNLVDNLADIYRNRRRTVPQKPIVKDGIITCNYGVTTCNYGVTTCNYGVTTGGIEKNRIEKNNSSSSSSMNRGYGGNKENKDEINIMTLADIMTAYSENIAPVNVQLACDIEAAFHEYGGDWLLNAIKEAGRQNKLKWSYIEGILRNWRQYGYKDPASRHAAAVRQGG